MKKLTTRGQFKTAPRLRSPNRLETMGRLSAISIAEQIALARTAGDLSPRPTSRRLERVSFVWEFPGAKRVFIAGSFNGWQPSVTPLKNRGGGRWLLDMDVKPGRYEYRFVVDGKWTDDPTVPGRSADGRNCVLIVTESRHPDEPAPVEAAWRS